MVYIVRAGDELGKLNRILAKKVAIETRRRSNRVQPINSASNLDISSLPINLEDEEEDSNTSNDESGGEISPNVGREQSVPISGQSRISQTPEFTVLAVPIITDEDEDSESQNNSPG